MKNIIKLGIISLIVLMILPMVLSIDNSYLQDNITLKVPCVDEHDSYCDNDTVCTLTVLDKDKNIVLDAVNMTFNNSFFSYVVNTTLEVGEYIEQVLCRDGSSSGYVNSQFQVRTDNDGVLAFGYCPTSSRELVLYAFFGIMLIFVTMFSLLVMKIPIFDVLTGIGWIVYSIFTIPCNWILSMLFIIVGLGMMFLNLFKRN